MGRKVTINKGNEMSLKNTTKKELAEKLKSVSEENEKMKDVIIKQNAALKVLQENSIKKNCICIDKEALVRAGQNINNAIQHIYSMNSVHSSEADNRSHILNIVQDLAVSRDIINSKLLESMQSDKAENPYKNFTTESQK